MLQSAVGIVILEKICPGEMLCQTECTSLHSELLWLLLFHGMWAVLSGIPINVLVVWTHGNHRSRVNWLMICRTSMWFVAYFCHNKYIIGRNCRMGIVFRVFNKCWGLQPSVTLSSWWQGWGTMNEGVNNSLLNHFICHFKAPILLF